MEAVSSEGCRLYAICKLGLYGGTVRVLYDSRFTFIPVPIVGLGGVHVASIYHSLRVANLLFLPILLFTALHSMMMMT